MGDRAVVHFKDGDEVSPGVYLHWGGSSVRRLLDRTEALMDGLVDLDYACARFIGIAHSEAPGSKMGLGVWSAPSGGIEAIRAPAYSHGDAGVFIVDIATSPWSVESHGGYGLIVKVPE